MIAYSISRQMRRIGSLIGCDGFIVWTFSSGNILQLELRPVEIIQLLHGLAVARFGSVSLSFALRHSFSVFGGSEGVPVIWCARSLTNLNFLPGDSLSPPGAYQ